MLQWITIFSHDLPPPVGHGVARQQHIGSLADRLDRPGHPARQMPDGSVNADARQPDSAS